MPSLAERNWVAPAEDRRLKIAGLVLIAGAATAAAFVGGQTLAQWPIALHRFVLVAAVSVLAVNLFAAGILVVAAGCGSSRSLRNPGRRRAIALQIVLANVLAPALLYGAIVDNPAAESALEARGWDVAGSIAAYLLLFVAWRLWRCSRRYDAIGADEAMALDPRPPVLYLRSFHDDDDALIDDGGSAITRHVMQAISPPSPEQEMADILARVGPVVAIGKPGEPLPQLGAARLYVSNDQWQSKVKELMAVARLVVVRLGASAGVLWEIEQALTRLPRQRLVLAVLGGSTLAPELVARLSATLGPGFQAALPQPPPRGWKSLLFKDPRRRIGGLICFGRDGSAQAVPVRTWPIALRDLIFAAMMRPSAAPLRSAFRRLFADTGMTTMGSGRRSRAVAVLLATLVGWTGAQWFYLGNRRRGTLYALAMPLFIVPYFLSVIDALRFIWVDRKEFDARFVAAFPAQRARNINREREGRAMNIYEQDLGKTAANFVALSPVSFVERSAGVFGDLEAVVHGARRYSWRQTRDRSARLAAALAAFGVGRGTTVSTMLHNTPEMVEAHYAVPALNAVLNTLNTRLDAPLLAWQMNHCETAVLLTDRELAPTVAQALRILREEHGRTPVVVDVCDAEFTGPGERVGSQEYEALLTTHEPLAQLGGPADEWDAIAVSYTSGTTGDPKGVVTHHRGAYLNAVCNAASWTMPHFPRYLWTLPMFHCNGWCFPWTVALLGGTHVCLRKVEAQAIFEAMRTERADHYCAAPIVHNLLLAAPEAMRAGITQKVRAMVAGAAPPAAMIEGMARIGFDLTHVYGLTEVYGPAAVAVKRRAWTEASISEQTRLNGRQGVRYALEEGMTVMDAATMREVPADGATMGEIMFRGNIVMKGYLKNAAATAESFAGGWFHTGDLAVLEPDRYVKIKDRSKDIIISGGENISSLEVEDALYRHAAVLACAVVARPDPKWGETPLAFIELRPGAEVTAGELVAHCRQLLASYKVPREIRFAPIPKTSTGKIQKFQLRGLARAAAAIDEETR